MIKGDRPKRSRARVSRPSRREAPETRRGPFLVAALLCERVIEEKDGTLTAVRLVDQLTIDLPPTEPNVVTVVAPLRLALLVSIREGEANHPYVVSITVRDPSGEMHALQPAGQILVAGAVLGGNFIANLSFLPQQEGMYYFEIEVDGRFLSRVPLSVVRRQAARPT